MLLLSFGPVVAIMASLSMLTGQSSDGDACIPSNNQSGIVTPSQIFRLKYPKSGRLILGAMNANLDLGLSTFHLHEGLQISLSCTDLVPSRLLKRLFFRFAKLRPFAVIYQCEPQRAINRNRELEQDNSAENGFIWKEVGHTETILYDVVYRFVSKFKVRFESPQDRNTRLRVEVYDDHNKNKDMHERNFIGAIDFSIDDILSEPLLCKKMGLISSRVADVGCLMVSGDAIRASCSGHPSENKIHLHVEFAPSAKGPHGTFYVLSRQLQSGEYAAVYRSTVIRGNTHSFEVAVLGWPAITGGADDTVLRLEIYQYNRLSKIIELGHIRTSVERMKDVAIGEELLWWPSTISTRNKMINIEQAVLVNRSVGLRQSQFWVGLC